MGIKSLLSDSLQLVVQTIMLESNIFKASINQSINYFILTCYVKELKNLFKIRTCINKNVSVIITAML